MNQKQGFFQVDTERLEAESNQPWEFADKLVCWASAVLFVLTLLIAFYFPAP